MRKVYFCRMTIGIVPARFYSTRFPGKPLVDIAGKSMIMRVVDQARKAKSLDRVVVATDDERIYHHVIASAGECVMTGKDHSTGTDRCFEALQQLNGGADFILNIQGDEPFVDPDQINQLAELIKQEHVQIASLVTRINDEHSLFNSNKVKVVFNRESGRVLYFSRQAIPHLQGISQEQWLSRHPYYKHLGLYAYKAPVLQQICRLTSTPLEKAECLEQLKWLEHGYSIHVAETPIESPSVDTPADLEYILKMISEKKIAD
jgi:3-deoxy-manno-octulosonate cytidylyltransferase (CMP-KDO synthetase)